MGSKESKDLAEASTSLESEIQRLSDQIQEIKENFDEIRKNLFPQKEILTTLTKIQEESAVLNQGLVKLLDVTEEQQVRVINLESQQIQLGALQEDQVKHLDEIKRNFNSRIAFYDKKVRDIKSACHYLENECFEACTPDKSFISDGKISARSKTINKHFNKRMNDSIGSGIKQSESIRGKLHKARLERWFTLKYEKRSLKFERETNENIPVVEENLSTMLFTKGDEEEDTLQGQDVLDLSGEEFETENGVGVGDI